jgi:hypothetical protein
VDEVGRAVAEEGSQEGRFLAFTTFLSRGVEHKRRGRKVGNTISALGALRA